MFKRCFMWLPLLALMGAAHADNEALRSKLEVIMPGAPIQSVEALDNTGLYEVIIDGSIYYFSADARYFFQGNVIDVESRENITKTKQTSIIKNKLASLNEADMIIYKPKKTLHTITVFTDIDCGYCRKLHSQMSEYNDLGIEVRYMAYPRGGLDSESYDKAEAVWCADDREQAMNDAKSMKPVEAKQCDSPVKAQFQLGHTLGVNGTPALFLESGDMLPGYVPPKRLIKILDDAATKG